MLLGLPPDSVRLIYTRGSGCYGLNGADAVTFDAAVLSQAAGASVRLQYSRQDEMMWENLGNACLVEHRAAISADGTHHGMGSGELDSLAGQPAWIR